MTGLKGILASLTCHCISLGQSATALNVFTYKKNEQGGDDGVILDFNEDINLVKFVG